MILIMSVKKLKPITENRRFYDIPASCYDYIFVNACVYICKSACDVILAIAYCENTIHCIVWYLRERHF